MTHEELIELAPSYALDALDAEQRTAFEAHLRGCATCREEVASYRDVAGVLAYAVPEARPANEVALRDRVLRHARRVRPISMARSTRVRAAPLAWIAAAACLTIAAASGVAYRVERSQRSQLQSEMAAVRAEIASRDSTIAAFFGPEVHVVSLSAPEHKPPMRVFWNHTRKVFIVTAHDLPAAPVGKTYQLWALAKGKAPISMGTFDVVLRGRAMAILPVSTGIEDAGFIDECALTVEPAGGSPQPTERPRLIGSWRHVN